MKGVILFSMMIFLLMPLVISVEKYSEEYNQNIVDEYIEKNPVPNWDIHAFEQRFGPTSAIIYLFSMILISIIFWAVVK